MGSRPSYGWRSIVFGKNLLSKGLKSVIGDGKDTLVWIDKWIFDECARRPVGLHSLMNINLKVASLIDCHSGLWNISLLRRLFHYDDVMRILSTPPLLARKDSFCWAWNRNGVYSVRSGYEMIFRLANKEKFSESTISPALFSVLADCWKVKTAPKIQVFLWKNIQGAIAVSARLATKGIKNYDGCLLCGAEEETINHILFLCPYARQVWALSHIPSPFGGFGPSEMVNLKYLITLQKEAKCTIESRSVFPWIVWLLWKNRNKLLFNGSLYPPDLLIQKAYEDSTAWLSAQLLSPEVFPISLMKDSHWSPPLWDEVKCNIGFSWSKKYALSGASWVVRDAMGTVLLHSRRSYSQVASVFEAKIRSWKWALESMQSLKFKKVLFGATTFEIIQALHKPTAWPSLVSHIFPLLHLSNNKTRWEIILEHIQYNLGTSRIARSVTSDYRISSYVAQGCPSWLGEFFDQEKKQAASLSHMALVSDILPL